mmetsp:Transcript_84437/g.225607  ORF Transcript_84437/g.225607 Transcript_84437/m.225607 type:complete len:336 (+) Transcript_84437:45-1052(+)
MAVVDAPPMVSPKLGEPLASPAQAPEARPAVMKLRNPLMQYVFYTNEGEEYIVDATVACWLTDYVIFAGDVLISWFLLSLRSTMETMTTALWCFVFYFLTNGLAALCGAFHHHFSYVALVKQQKMFNANPQPVEDSDSSSSEQPPAPPARAEDGEMLVQLPEPFLSLNNAMNRRIAQTWNLSKFFVMQSHLALTLAAVWSGLPVVAAPYGTTLLLPTYAVLTGYVMKFDSLLAPVLAWVPSFLAAVALFCYYRSGMGLLAMGIMALSVCVLMNKWALSPRMFNHNALFHVISFLSLIMLYFAVRETLSDELSQKIKDKIADTLAHAPSILSRGEL